MSEKILENLTIESAFVPIDMQAGANDGDWVNLSKYERVLVVLFKAAGTAGDDPVFTLRQAKDNAGGSAKALDFTVIKKKVGTLSAITSWSRVTQAAGNTHTDTVSAEAQALMAVEIDSSQLDVNNGFTHVQLQVPDVGGNAQIGCGFYVMYEPRYPQADIQTALD